MCAGMDVPVTKLCIWDTYGWALLRNSSCLAWGLEGFIPSMSLQQVADVVGSGPSSTVLFKNGSVAAYPADSQDIPDDVQVGAVAASVHV